MIALSSTIIVGAWGRADFARSFDRPRRPTMPMWPNHSAIPPAVGRARQDATLKIEVRRVFDENFRVYGVRRVCGQRQRDGLDVAVARVRDGMRDWVCRGSSRVKSVKKTTVSDKAAPCLPLESRQPPVQGAKSRSPLALRRTYVATDRLLFYVAVVIDAYAADRGLAVSAHDARRFVLDAAEQALQDRRPFHRGGRRAPERPGQPSKADSNGRRNRPPALRLR